MTPSDTSLAVLREARELIAKLQFSAFGMTRCPLCAGWMVGPNGETDKAHTKQCPIPKAIARITSALSAQADGWRPIESVPDEGRFLVYLESEMLGSRVHTAKWHPNMKTIGGVFHFDAPRPTHWMPMPAPPQEKP